MQISAAQELSLPITGMHCAACVARVEKALAAVAGVRKAEVLLTDSRAQLQLEPGWSAVALMAALRKVGYDVPLTQASLSLSGLHDAADALRAHEALARVPGVVLVQVNLGSATVALQALPSTAPAALLQAARGCRLWRCAANPGRWGFGFGPGGCPPAPRCAG